MPIVLLMFCTLFLYTSMAAAYFDEWWHIAGKVETFFTLPHSILYASIFLNGMIILCVVLYRLWKSKSFIPLHIAHHRYLALAGTGSLFQLLSGVSDGLYHNLVGFDVSVWSPPHLGAIFGGMVAGIGMAGLWLTSQPRLSANLGGAAALGAALAAAHFSLSEYTVGSRFSIYPEYYAIIDTLMLALVLVIGIYMSRKPIAVVALLWLFVFDLIIWAVWKPIYSGSHVVTYPFPYFTFICAVLIDVCLYIPKIRKQTRLLIGACLFSISLNGLVLALGHQMNAGQWIYSVVGSLLAASAACFFGKYLSRYGEVSAPSFINTRKSFLQIGIMLLIFVPATAFAHEEGFKRAPDMHPIWVMFEFIALFWLAYYTADRISRFRSKHSKHTKLDVDSCENGSGL